MNEKFKTEHHYQQLVLRLLLSSTDSPMAVASEACRSAVDPGIKAFYQDIADSMAGIRMLLQSQITVNEKNFQTCMGTETIDLIETRMRILSQLKGEVIICCDKGKSKDSPNAGKAICMVHSEGARVMTDDDVKAACIGNIPGRYAYPLHGLRHFSSEFNFTDYAVTKNWQGIFKLRVPDSVMIFPFEPGNDEPEFTSCSECDGHPACEDFGCAVGHGLGRMLKKDFSSDDL